MVCFALREQLSYIDSVFCSVHVVNHHTTLKIIVQLYVHKKLIAVHTLIVL